MLTVVLISLLALGLSAFTYLALERVGRVAWVPVICRAVAWGSLGLLLVNLSCPVRGAPLRPLVLLDASLSLGAAGGRWVAARDSALRWGEVRTFGDERLSRDTAPTRGRSLLAPALLAASASDRPVLVVSDGEIEDRQDIPQDILTRSGVRLFLRNQRPDFAITHLEGPSRVTAGDSVLLEVLAQALGMSGLDTVSLQVSVGDRRLGRRTLRLTGENAGRTRIAVPTTSLSPGTHLLRVSAARRLDDEPRTDSRLHLVTVTPTPGVVLLAGPADWDSRFLYRTIREVSQLPVKGYVRLDGSRWRSMANLRPVSTDQVRRAARQADLLVLKGGVAAMSAGSQARGVWIWPSGEGNETPQPGDWYLSAAPSSPIAGAFLGQPVDSFPPAVQLSGREPGRSSWIGLYAQLGRRGAQRPAVFGSQDGGTRQVTVAVDGLWRWAFRGGSSEQAYRSWVAMTVSWLLGGVDSSAGVTRPLQPVVQNGRPVVFEWLGSGATAPVALAWSGPDRQRVDTLHFDGNGRATVWLAPGQYRYRTEAGSAGMVAVEEYSDELIPRAVTLTSHNLRADRPSGRSVARDWLWLFGLCILALSCEWLARRRLGLR